MFGTGADGRLGAGPNSPLNALLPLRLEGPLEDRQVTQVACGLGFTIALCSDNSVFAWGKNEYGQLGTGNNTTCDTPTRVKLQSSCGRVMQVAAGGYHCLALMIDGALYGWGSADGGRLGFHSSTDVYEPVRASFFDTRPLQQISCGCFYSLALTRRGTVYSFGKNSFGQLGIGSLSSSAVPSVISSLNGKGIRQVSCGLHHAIAMTLDYVHETANTESFGPVLRGSWQGVLTSWYAGSPQSSIEKKFKNDIEKMK